MSTEYTLIRSKRRSLSIQIGKDGELIARAPKWMPLFAIEAFIRAKSRWIEKHQTIRKQASGKRKKYSDTELLEMKKELLAYIVDRVAELWGGKGLSEYTSIKITKSERRWGSCSGKNGLCFSYRLAEYLDSSLSFSERESALQKKKDPPSEGDKCKSNSGLYQCTMTRHSPFIDAIIIHELAHLREKHHQKPFWDLVYSMMPEYDRVMKGVRDDF